MEVYLLNALCTGSIHNTFVFILETIRINVVLRFVLERTLEFRYATKSNLEVMSMNINKLMTPLIIISLLTWNSNILYGGGKFDSIQCCIDNLNDIPLLLSSLRVPSELCNNMIMFERMVFHTQINLGSSFNYATS